jgi:fructokinase
LGELLFDQLADQPGLPYHEVTSWTPYPGGAPANVACALVKLGTSSGFIGCLGEDEAGEQLVDVIRTTGVNGLGIQRHATAPTRSVYVVRSPNGERQFAGFGDRDTREFADTQLQGDLLPLALFEAADFLVLGTLELAYPKTRQAIEFALELAERYFLKILVDVNWRPMFWPDPGVAKPIIQALLKQVDFLKLSDDEAEWLFGTRDPGVIAHRVGDLEGVLITAGEKGCSYCLSEHEGHVPAFGVEVEDTTGAGDSFVAGFLHQVCQQGMKVFKDPHQIKELVTYASAVGALTTTRSGAIAAQPTAAEVDAFLYLQSSNG